MFTFQLTNRLTRAFWMMTILALLAASAAQVLRVGQGLSLNSSPPAARQLPLAFLALPGMDDRFQALSTMGAVQFSDAGIYFQEAQVSQVFEGANPAVAPVDRQRLSTLANYYLGNDPESWYTGLPAFAATHYLSLYPSIDLKYEGAGGQLKSTYTISPGTEPRQIRWHYQGAAGTAIDPDSGDLLVALKPQGVQSSRSPAQLIERAPVAWQMQGGQRIPVAVQYSVDASGTVSFNTGAYDPTRPLIIDPVISYSSYLGGTLADTAQTVAVDSQGYAYIAGSTHSTNFLNHPGTSGTEDVWVIKVNPAGSAYDHPDLHAGWVHVRLF